MRLNKFIAHQAVASRREADKLIEQGCVLVNGSVVTTPGIQIGESDIVTYTFDLSEHKKSKIYIKLNKPRGYVVSKNKDEGIPIAKLIKGLNKDIYPVGRLDKDSSGLIIFTNDGVLSRKIISENSGIEKEYYVKVDNDVTDTVIKKLEYGITLDGKKLKKTKIKRIDKSSFYITLTEGKNRQIRRMCSKVGIEVIVLKRIRIAQVMLERLESGKWVHLTEKEIASIMGS